MEKQFWMVLNESTGYIVFKHRVRNEAIIEAKRLAKANKGHKFIILESDMFVLDPIQDLIIQEYDKIPF